MDFVKKALRQFAEHLKTLSLSQRLVVFLCFALMAIALGWLVSYSAKPEMVPVLDQAFSSEELARAERELRVLGIPFKVDGARILVHGADVTRAQANLQFADALPKDTTENWMKMVNEMDAFMPQGERSQRWKVATEQRLAQVIRQMPGVRRADVIVNTGGQRLFGEGRNVEPTASVHIQMQRGQQPEKRLAGAAADLVAGAFSGLVRKNVNLVIDGAPYRFSEGDQAHMAELLDRQRAIEKQLAENIELVLGIPNVRVGVYVELETDKVESTMRKYGDPVPSLQKTKESTSERSRPSGEPGVRPNVGASIATEGGPAEKTVLTEGTKEFNGERDLEQVRTEKMPGGVKSIRATVNVPYSYFLRVYQMKTGKKEEPKPQEIEPVIVAQSDEIRRKVMPIINAVDTKGIEVGRYYDLALAGDPAGTGTGGGATAALMEPGSLMQYAKPAGLGVLALSSFMMVLMMLRRASSSAGVAELEKVLKEQEAAPTLDTEQGPIGEAQSTEGVLQGVEVDEQTVRVRHIAEQVGTLVNEDPDMAAHLVRQWIAKDK